MAAADQQRLQTSPRGGVLVVGVLGPLEVVVDGRPVVVSAGRLRAVLATLAMSAGRPVSIDRLAATWDEELPADTRRAVRTYMTRLRRVLGAGLIAATPGGYVLRVAAEQVDGLRFERLLDAAAAAAGPTAERALLGEALALWRGTPFEGVASAWLRESVAPVLVERHLRAVERRVDLDIAAGCADELVPELTELTARYPLRESLWVRLLVVLARCGRQAEALECYERVRLRLAEELGADPGAELQAVHADLLAGRLQGAVAPAQSVARGWVVPRQLPADIDSFTGRRGALAALDAMFGDGDGLRRGVVVCSISGMAGVGKTALAVRAAQRLAERFPDGQLYVNLHGASAELEPLAPLEVLGRFLRALGVEAGAVPAGVEEAAALFRSWVTGRRLLVVLDDAADDTQVAPLLPASPGCGVLVTSRRVPSVLGGARQLRLDVLDQVEAVALLGRLAGAGRVAAEPAAAAEVARCCGYLPLALRLAGARLAARPAWPVRALAERLACQERRLDQLEVAQVGARASFSVSWQQLGASQDGVDKAAAQAFALLGVLDGSELSVPVVARLLRVPEVAAEEVLERLVDAQLLRTPSPGRYRLHDLLRLYARELACQHTVRPNESTCWPPSSTSRTRPVSRARLPARPSRPDRTGPEPRGW